jgi:hypothetical protein
MKSEVVMSDGLASPDEEAHFSKRLEEHDDFTKTDSNSNEGISLIKDRTFGGIVKNHTECHLSIGKTVWAFWAPLAGAKPKIAEMSRVCKLSSNLPDNQACQTYKESRATRLWQLVYGNSLASHHKVRVSLVDCWPCGQSINQVNPETPQREEGII